MDKLFIYCPKTATKDALVTAKNRGYELLSLTDDPKVFWEAIHKIDKGGTLVLFSHGDADGPLLVSGQNGKDMTVTEIKELAGLLTRMDITLYLLSCNTGSGGFAAALQKLGVKFVAPKGYALTQSSVAGLTVLSIQDASKAASGSNLVGWVSNPVELAPNRASKPLYLP